MEKVKIKDKSNGAVIEVAKSLASDFIGTGKFELHTEENKDKKLFIIDKTKEEKNEN